MEEKKWKKKFEELKEKSKDNLKKAECWVHNNKEAIISCAPIALASLGFAGSCVKKQTKKMQIKHEDNKRLMQIYDPSNGFYIHLKRPLTKEEKVLLANKPKDMNNTIILDALNLIKK